MVVAFVVAFPNELVILSLCIDVHNHSCNITSATNTSTSGCIIIVIIIIIIALRQHVVLFYIRVLLVFPLLPPSVLSFLHFVYIPWHILLSVPPQPPFVILYFYYLQWIVSFAAEGSGKLSFSCTTSFLAAITEIHVIFIVVIAVAVAVALALALALIIAAAAPTAMIMMMIMSMHTILHPLISFCCLHYS